MEKLNLALRTYCHHLGKDTASIDEKGAESHAFGL